MDPQTDRQADRKCMGTSSALAALKQTDSYIQTHTRVLLCLACSANVSVYTACDGSGRREEIAPAKRVASSEGGSPSVQTAPR